nr:hypothetical protein [Streptomyces sp. GS7]
MSSEDLSAITHIMRAKWRSLSLTRFMRPPVVPVTGRLTYFDDVDEVFEVPRLADEAVEVVEDDAVDNAVCEVGEEQSELGSQDDPVDGAVGLDD